MLSDLCSIIQLLATLSIGFVILDYSDFFTKVLKTKFFHADETLEKAEKEFRSYIPEKETRDALQPTAFSSGDTSGKIEELKRLCETTEDNIKEFKNTSTEELENAVKLRSLASLCLFLTMVYVTFLFVPTLKHLYGGFVCNSLVPFTIFSMAYVVLGWVFGECDKKCCLLKFGSLWHPIMSFIAKFIVSIALAASCPVFFARCGVAWEYLFVSVVLLGLVNFIAYALIIWHSIKKFKENVEKRKTDIINECKNIDGKYKDLLKVAEMAKDCYGSN